MTKKTAIKDLILALSVVGLLLSACASPKSSADKLGEDSNFEIAPPSSPEMDAQETARALSDPDLAVLGTWSLLSHLGIGVYTPDGEQILAGSEATSSDFWLYEFEVATLAKMARMSDRSLSSLREILGVLGFETNTEDLATFYRVMFATFPDYFLSQLFTEMGVEFTGDPELTRLQEWLLLVTLLPPNGSTDDRSSFPSPVASTSVLASQVSSDLFGLAVHHNRSNQNNECSSIKGGGKDPAYALADQLEGALVGGTSDAVIGTLAERETAAGLMAKFNEFAGKLIGRVLKLKDAVQLGLLVSNFTVQISTVPHATHEVHDKSGESAEDKRVTVTAKVHFDGVKKEGKILCGSYAGMNFPPPGPIPGASVRFRIDSFLLEHGHIRYEELPDVAGARLLTDDNGEAKVWYEPKNERPRESQGEGTEKNGNGMIEVETEIVGAMGEYFNAFSFMEIFYDLFDVFVIDKPITVSWHEAGWLFDARWHVTDGFEDDTADFTWKGTFQVDETGVIAGRGDGKVSGSCGPDPYIDFPGGTYAGTWSFEITGNKDGNDFIIWLQALNPDLKGAECPNFPENTQSLIEYIHLWFGEMKQEIPITIPASPGTHPGPKPLGQDTFMITLSAPDA